MRTLSITYIRSTQLKPAKRAVLLVLCAVALTALAICGACSSSGSGGDNGNVSGFGGATGGGSGGTSGVPGGAGGSSGQDGGSSGQDGGSSGQDGGSSGQDGGSSGQAEPKVGGFDIRLVQADPASGAAAHTLVVGRVDEAAQPELIIWEVADEQGGCKLLEPRTPFCDPACASGSACVKDGQCVAYPESRNIGTVQLEGLRTEAGTSAISIEPINNNYQPSAAVAFEYPPFDEGDPIRLETGGGDYAPFVLQSKGILPLELLADDDIPMTRGEPLLLQWAPPGQPDIARIQVALDIAHHGGERGEITCDVEDSGSLEIAASLVTGLMDLGISGFPSITVTRIAAGSTTIEPGLVELAVLSQQERFVQIPGLVSCTEDSECPSGQTCQWDLRCM